METIITKSYQGAQTRLLLPKVKDVAGVIGDNNSTKLVFKIPKSYDTGWVKFIEFDCYVIRDNTEVKPTYPLDENNSFVVPYEITESNIGKEVDYNLKFVSDDGEIIEKSEMATLYFRDSSNGTLVDPDPYTDVLTFLYNNAFCNVSYSDGTTIGEGSEQLPKLTFTPMNQTGDAEEISLNIPYLDENGTILNKFINKEIVVEIFKIASSNDLRGLSTAQAPDMALVSLASPSSPEYMNLYMLVGNNPANIDNWYLIHTDSPIFKTVNVSGDVNIGGVSTLTSVVTESLTFDDPNLSEKVLVTDANGVVTTDSSLTLDELHALVGITGNIQDQIDDEAQTRHNDDVALQGAIYDEITARQNAIAGEAQARQNAIASEAEERGRDDNALGARIDREIVDRTNADNTLEGLIQTEAEERQAAYAELFERKVEKISPSPAGEGFVKVDVNEQGQVIGHSSMVESDIPTLSISKTNGLQTALDGKVDKTITVNGHALSSNVTVTKGDVELGNCDNTSDADKPVSMAQQTALNGKLDNSQLVDAFTGHISDDTYIPSAKLVSTNLDTKVDKTFDSTLFDGASFPRDNVTDSGVSIRFTTKNTNNNYPGTLDVALPVASGGENGRAGIATKAQIDQIEQNRQDIALLSGKSSRYAINVNLTGKTDAQIQTELTSAWRTASGQLTGDPDEYTTLVNLWNNHEYTWLDVSGTESWVDRGISTVSTATNSSLGVVMGTPDPQDDTSNGCIFVEPNGTMNVLGWNDVTTAVSNNASAISSLQSGKVDKLTTKPTAGTYTKLTINTEGQVTTGTTLSASDIPSLDWSKIASGKPTTLSGYGITDAVSSNTTITGATKCKITYDSKGLVTSGADLVETDIPALSISKTTGLQTALDAKVTGPSSAVSNNNIALFDGTTGKLIKDSGKTIGASIPAPTSSDKDKALIVVQSGNNYVYDFGEAGKVDDVKVNGSSVVNSNKEAIITVPTTFSELTSHPTTLSGYGITDAVPNSRTINGAALSSNVTLDGADITLTGYSKPSSTSAVATTDTVNQAIGKIESGLDTKAPLASPALTGTPTAPTATAGTNTTQIATTAFVKTAIDNIPSATGTVTNVATGAELTGGPITTSGTISHATSGVTAGTYQSVTVNTYGHVTAGSNPFVVGNIFQLTEVN